MITANVFMVICRVFSDIIILKVCFVLVKHESFTRCPAVVVVWLTNVTRRLRATSTLNIGPMFDLCLPTVFKIGPALSNIG